MKINKATIPADFADDGLSKIEMDRLGDIVLIAGKNGSGKTRLLNRIKQCVNNRLNCNIVEQKRTDINNCMNSIINNPSSQYVKSWENQIELWKKEISYIDYVSFNEEAEKYVAVNFVPNKLNLNDSGTLGKKQLIEKHNKCLNVGINTLNDDVFPYIQTEFNRYLIATHPNITVSEEEKQNAIASYNRLNELILNFLGIKLIGNLDGECTIFGLEFGKSQLSDGQKILLQLCVAIHAQGASLNNIILLLDEPENHLHPAALIDFISSIIESLNNGQIWIATHSINLLSYMDTSCIWYMDNNAITYSGRTPERVLKGLLGTEDQIHRLQEFIGLPAELASNQFAFECLFAPNAIITGKDDKQTKQLRDALANKSLGKQIRVLDYGAGKGRLAESIYFSDENQEKDLIKGWLDYFAFDEYATDKIYCKNAINRIYDKSDNRYFNTQNDVLGTIDENTCDVIVMSNVLHEIPPTEWLKTFKKDAMINKLLKDTGYLLVVEDLLIPIGEKPHKDGFFVLGLTEIKKLFSISENDFDFKYTDVDENKRLLAYLIPKDCLIRINDDSVKATLKMLKEHSKSEILRLRSRTDYKSGRFLGFWTQQLANSILVMDD